MIKKCNKNKNLGNNCSQISEFNLTSIINSLTRFHPDFHHVGGEIKSGCDYKKRSVQRRLTPIYFLAMLHIFER